MRVIDLILLMSDFNKNNRILVENSPQNLAVVDVQIVDQKIILQTSTKLKGLKNWEFILMINKTPYYKLPVFFSYQKKHQQLFGFRVTGDQLLLG
ncbi:hypothetical protein [Companilactobacillus keshanensis]|uniref:Uncharacterized protein n=1 Tax=Companilactobacillus keshanensis TaxID=2486003 RepID=A0ABW4BWD4_9LACO|nr:hypothetical protein [Companilactobacillus keshanensis]